MQGTLELIIHFQCNLPHKVVMWIKQRVGKYCKALLFPMGEKCNINKVNKINKPIFSWGQQVQFSSYHYFLCSEKFILYKNSLTVPSQADGLTLRSSVFPFLFSNLAKIKCFIPFYLCALSLYRWNSLPVFAKHK